LAILPFVIARPSLGILWGAWWWLALPLLLGACGQNNDGSPSELVCTESNLSDRDASDLFDGGGVPRFDLRLTDGADWSGLLLSARDEEYQQAYACYDGQAIGNIAFRFKGQAGLAKCFEGDDLVCRKLSLRFKFDAVDGAKRFYGLRRLNLHAMVGDLSYLRERLGYDLYRAAGVDSPRSGWAELWVDGEPRGLYSMVEQIDGQFAKSRWPEDGDGDLYKEAWPVSTDPDYYRAHLENNESSAEPDALISLAKGLAEAAPGEQRDVLGRSMDEKQLLRYMAVDDALFNWDGVTTFYADRSHNHNFYIYAPASTAKASPSLRLIPWDLDHTFEIPNWHASAPHWREPVQPCPYISVGSIAANCDPIFRALAEDEAGYRSAVHELLAGPFAEGALEAQLDEHVNRLRAAVERAPFGVSVRTWNDNVAALRAQLPLLRTYVTRRADGPPLRRVTLPTTGIADLSSYDDLELMLGFISNDGTHTKARVQKTEAAGPISGLRFSGAVSAAASDGELPYFGMALDNPDSDVHEMSGVRFRARANNLYAAGVVLSSALDTPTSNHFSWFFQLSETPELYELRFAELSLPEGTLPDATLTQEQVLTHLQGLGFWLSPATLDSEAFIELADFEFF
jgi:spore coat protein H